MPRGRRARDGDTAYLAELISDFGAPNCPAADEALIAVSHRYTLLNDIFVESDRINTAGDVRADPRDIPRIVHAVLYQGILLNAGQYRSADDPGGGHVYFGPPKHSRASSFKGVPPAAIEAEMERCLDYLAGVDSPKRRSAQFYLHLSRIHPYYDANGRVGRLTVQYYLRQLGFHMMWAKMDTRDGKLMQKINACLKRHDSGHGSEEYFGYLLKFWEEHIVEVGELDE